MFLVKGTRLAIDGKSRIIEYNMKMAYEAAPKKKRKMKSSVSIIWNMSDDHYDSQVSFYLGTNSEKTYPIRPCDANLQRSVIKSML